MRIRGIKDNRALHGPTRLTQVLLLAGGYLGGMLVLIGTHPYGAAVTPDSAMYIAAAKSLLAGEGYRGYDGAPFVQWPPLYPTLLALGGILGADPMQTAPVLHAVAFGVLVSCAGWLFFSHLREPRFAWIGFLAVLLSWPLLQVAMKIWSELIFVLLTLLFLGYAPALLARPTWPRLILFALLAALAAMQRYAGLALILAGTGMILRFMNQASIRRRTGYALGFCLMAVGPLLVWLIRNHRIASTLTGDRTTSAQLMIPESVSHFAGTLSTWLVPPLLPAWMGIVLGTCLVAVMTLGFTAQARSENMVVPLHDRVVLLFVGVYTVFVLVSSTIQAAALPDNRLLSPLYVPLAYLFMTGFERSTKWGSGYVSNTGTLQRVVAGACMVWLLYPAMSTAMYVTIRASYNTNAWHESALARWLQENPPEGRLYSNQPWVVYLTTEQPTRRLPGTDIDAYLYREVAEHSQPCLLVWFYGVDRGQDHASRFLHDFFRRILSVQDSTHAEGLSRALLDFMRRSGLASRQDSSGEPHINPTDRNPLPATHVQLVKLFDDGALYVFPAERSTDR